MNVRMLPPVSIAEQARTVNGRGYSAARGAVVDILDDDALMLEGKGWVRVAPSGPTSARPVGTLGQYTNLPGSMYFDTTLSKLIISDGVSWRDLANGNAV